jgi:DNA-binding GntR family transcriptional regulator
MTMLAATGLPSRVDWAYLALKNAILKGELESGEQLKEKALAERLGISPTPIREALARLEQEYLVESAPYRGTYVTGLTRKDVCDIYGVRQALEDWAIELITPTISTETLAELDALLASEREEIGKGRYAVHIQNDLTFHGTILKATDNKWLVRISGSFNDHVYRIRSLLGPIPQPHIEKAFAEHVAVLDGLKERDCRKARLAMEGHLTLSAERTIELLVAARSKEHLQGGPNGSLEPSRPEVQASY